jgi:hypothetical protein
MDTSIAPVAQPEESAPTIAIAKLAASPIVIIPDDQSGNAANVISRAPSASASRPPDLHRKNGRGTGAESMIAMCVASMPSLSRKEGSKPPYPPITVPLMTNINVTAMAASRVESRFVTVIAVVIRCFSIGVSVSI